MFHWLFCARDFGKSWVFFGKNERGGHILVHSFGSFRGELPKKESPTLT
jgi:hypothetical protein